MRLTVTIAACGALALAGCTVTIDSPTSQDVPDGGGSSAADASAAGTDGSGGGTPEAGAGDGASAGDAGGHVGTDGGGGVDANGAAHDASSTGDGSSAGFVVAPHPAWPQVGPNQSVVLQPMKLVAVVSSGDPLASDFFAFTDALAASQWWKTVTSEYGVGTVSATAHVTGPAITTSPDDAAMDSYVQQAISGMPSAAPNGKTLYMLFLPPGIAGIDPQSGLNTGCQFYAGYHVPYGTGGDSRGVVQRCPLQPGGPTELQDATITASHEIIEAATDPASGTGWNMGDPSAPQPWTHSPWIAGLQGEVGDLCTGTEWTEGSYTYQRVWSNAAAAGGGDPCKPAYVGLPYYNTSAAQGWYTIAAGGTVDIQLTGFSTATTTDWSVYMTVLSSSASGFDGTILSPTTVSQQGTTFEMTNNGRTSTLKASAPAGAPSGSWAVYGIESVPQAGVAGDPQHLWTVGVHVP